MIRHFNPVSGQRELKCLLLFNRQISPAEYYQIKANQILLVLPEALSDYSLDKISINCPFQIFLGYRHTQPSLRQVIWTRQYGKKPVRASFGPLKYPFEYCWSQQSDGSRKSCSNFLQLQPKLRCQSGTTLGTTGINDLSTTAGSHAGTKTVSTDTLKIAGLEGSFHCYSPNKQKFALLRHAQKSCQKKRRRIPC